MTLRRLVLAYIAERGRMASEWASFNEYVVESLLARGGVVTTAPNEHGRCHAFELHTDKGGAPFWLLSNMKLGQELIVGDGSMRSKLTGLRAPFDPDEGDAMRATYRWLTKQWAKLSLIERAIDRRLGNPGLVSNPQVYTALAILVAEGTV